MPLDKRKSSHNREAEKLNRISFSSSIRRVFRIALFFLSISRSLSLSPLVRCRLICHTHTHLLDGSAYETLYRVCTSHYRKSRHAKMDNFGFRENRHIDLDFFPFGNMVFVCVLCACVSDMRFAAFIASRTLCQTRFSRSRQLFLSVGVYASLHIHVCGVCMPNRCCASLVQCVQKLEFTFVCLRRRQIRSLLLSLSCARSFAGKTGFLMFEKQSQTVGQEIHINGADQ